MSRFQADYDWLMAQNSIKVTVGLTVVVLYEVGKAFIILVFITDHNCFSMN